MQIVQGPTPLDQSHVTSKSPVVNDSRNNAQSMLQKNRVISASHENLLEDFPSQEKMIEDNIERMKFRYDGYISYFTSRRISMPTEEIEGPIPIKEMTPSLNPWCLEV